MQYLSEPGEPSQRSLQVVARWSEEIVKTPGDLSAWVNNYLANHQQRIAFDLDMLVSHAPEGGKILEVGSVPPLLTASLADVGFSVTGIDLAPDRMQDLFEQLKITVHKCDIEREPLPVDSGLYDVVVFNEVFEHLRINPIYTLKEVFRVLRPGGVLFLSTPNMRSLRGIENLLFRNQCYSCSPGVYSQYEKLGSIGHMGHVREYTTREVVEFLREIGFEAEKIIYRGKDRSRLRTLVTRFVPSLRLFFSCIARKPTEASAG